MASAISHAQLNAQLAQGTVAPLYVIVGEDDLLRDMALGSLKAALLGEGESDFNCDLFYGDDVSGTEIVTCASEVAVFAPRRVVVVKAADKLPARECDAILPYLKEPNDSTTMIFVAPKLDGRLKFTQALSKAAVTVDCSPLREAQWLPWLRQDAERVGIQLNEEAIELLKEACGGSLYSVRRELEKLAAYVSPGLAVTAGDVATLRGTEPGASVFDLTLAIGARDHGRVLAILARNLEAGEAPLTNSWLTGLAIPETCGRSRKSHGREAVRGRPLGRCGWIPTRCGHFSISFPTPTCMRRLGCSWMPMPS